MSVGPTGKMPVLRRTFALAGSVHLPFERWTFRLRCATARKVGACHAEASGVGGLDVCLVKPQQRIALIKSERFFRDFPPSKRYLIGVSGGRDSIALLN